MPQRKRVIRKGRKRPTLRGKKQTVSQAIKKYVKRAIHVQQENKQANYNPVSTNFGSISNSTNLNMRPLLPYPGYNTISQGIGQGQRIGNEVKIRKITLNYIVIPKPYSSTTPGNPFPEPVIVDLFLGNLKQAPALLPGTVDIGYLFQGGNASLAPSGLLDDTIATVNTDYWNIKKRWQHKIGFSSITGTASNATWQYFANNDFKMNAVRKMDITKLCPKTFKFNDTDGTLQGPNLFFFFQAVSAVGITQGSGVQNANIRYWVNISYEDA